MLQEEEIGVPSVIAPAFSRFKTILIPAAVVSAVVVGALILVMAASSRADSPHQEMQRDVDQMTNYGSIEAAGVDYNTLITRDVDVGEARHVHHTRVLLTNVKAAIFNPSGVSITTKIKKAISGVNTLIVPVTSATPLSLLQNIASTTGYKLILQTLTDPKFALNTSIALAKTNVNAATKLCVSLGSTCLGLQFDIEPHLGSTWSTATTAAKQQIINQMGNVLQTVKATIPANISVGLNLPYFYFSTLNLTNVVNKVDNVVVKVYDGVGYTFMEILSLLTGKISSTSAQVKNIPYIVGIGVSELGLPSIASAVASSITTSLKTDPNFVGTNINSVNTALSNPSPTSFPPSSKGYRQHVNMHQ